MSETYHYFSLQYSAIQKTVLRHDRLWSIAGISQILSVLNELELPRITKSFSGDVLVAGGGKFTAKFKTPDDAKNAASAITKTVSTTLPMLEFQASKITEAETLGKAKENDLITGLSEQKRRFRGYGVSYNPHMEVCEECGEYPAVETSHRSGKRTELCRACFQSWNAGRDLKDILALHNEGKPLTSLEQIYAQYWSLLAAEDKEVPQPSVPTDFEKLFPKQKKPEGGAGQGATEDRKRMAVWFSDANNMNGKVPIWLSQDDALIPKIFKEVKEVNIRVISKALKEVFPRRTWKQHEGEWFLPFRLVVAGGDDLCLVMPEEHVLDFALVFSKQVSKEVGNFKPSDFLHKNWLENKYRKWLESQKDKETDKSPPGPYCFGASFVITPVHTPFKAIHSLGESLMSKAKKETNREADSVNWQLLNVDEQEEQEISLEFEKPLFIQKKSEDEIRSAILERLTFENYLELRNDYSKLSNSQMKNIASALISAKGDSGKAELALIKSAVAAKEKGLTGLLSDPKLRVTQGEGKGLLDLPKVATLLELLNIKRGEVTK
jgi:hypothetical protein